MKTKLISFVIPVFNETEVLPELVERTTNVANQLQNEYNVEIILIDDGSDDDTWNQIVSTGKADTRFKGIKLAGNVGQQAALLCGCKNVKGDVAIILDADLQDPPEIALQLIEEWERGAEIVFAVRKTREGEPPLRLALIHLYYWLRKKIIKTYIPGNTGSFVLIDRKAVDALNSTNEQHPYVRGIIGKLGFKRSAVFYDRKPRGAGVGKFPLHKLFKLAADGIFSMSAAPLKLAFAFAAVITLCFIAYLIFVFIYCGVQDKVLPWFNMALSFMIYFSALMLFIFLGIVGEYIGRIYDEVKARPLYFVDKTTNL